MDTTTIILIHGLCGNKNEFNKLINSIKKKYKNPNFINVTRSKTSLKSLYTQAQEIEKELEKIHDLKNQKIILIGHSQGSIICLFLIKRFFKKNLRVSKLFLIGTPFQGLDYIKNHFDYFRKKYNKKLIDFLERNLICDNFKSNPKGILNMMKKSLDPLLYELNNVIETKKIPTYIFVCTKPNNFKFPQSIWEIYKKNFAFFIKKRNLSLFKIVFLLLLNIFNPLFYLILINLKQLYKENFFNADYFTNQRNDLMVGEINQKWPLKNKHIKHFFCKNVVHNNKLSSLCKNLGFKLEAELESTYLINKILNLLE